jgi:acyl-CoA hydrolase
MNEYSKNSMHMTVLMTPDMANFTGTVHGGDILKQIDQVAYACAARYCGKYVVTLSVDRVLFKHPIQVGELVTFYANVNYTGKTSMEVGIKVIAENITNGTVRHTNSCYVTMIALDKKGKPTQVPKLKCISEIEIRRFAEGKFRKAKRLIED